MEMLKRISACQKYWIFLSKDIADFDEIPYSCCLMLAPKKGVCRVFTHVKGRGYVSNTLPVWSIGAISPEKWNS